ncbi:putative pentatricopeptide repeat-containing protein-like [Capsicum annuum]|nr:putative pentatricopeptide repeat-containing protein-like [Capsicum annuum]KAF3626202.1 putative pentatricopeptide repeat-containing protein-like [Capsicum annuum]
MGNCIVLQEKVVKVIKTDEKILEYKAPIKVHQILSQFPNHVISNSLQIIDQNLLPNDDMLGGKIYYLLPILPRKPAVKKKVKFADDSKNVVRIKIVISKKELEALLMSNEGGLIAVDHIANHSVKKEHVIANDILHCSVVDDNSIDRSKGWKPVLDNIPEID